MHQAASAHGSTSIEVTIVVGATALLYLRGLRRFRRCFPERAAGCSPSAFFGGLLVIWIVIASPLSTLDHRLLTFHMVQHLLLMTIAAPLLLRGTPGGVFLRGLPLPVRRASTWLLGTAPALRIGRSLTHPFVCWMAGTVVVVAWHIPAAHELSMASSSWHLIQHVTFLAGGLLFWFPVMRPDRGSARLPRSLAPLYLFLATLPCDALSAFLCFCGRALYPPHHVAHATFGLSALQDQELAGALMWFWVTIAYLLPATVGTIRMLAPGVRESDSNTLVEANKPGPAPATSKAGSLLLTRPT